MKFQASSHHLWLYSLVCVGNPEDSFSQIVAQIIGQVLRGNHAADQRLCFCCIDSAVPLLPKCDFKPLDIFCGCTARFVSDLVGNPVFFMTQLKYNRLITCDLQEKNLCNLPLFWLF